MELKKEIQALSTNTCSVRRLSYPDTLGKVYAVRQFSAAIGLVPRLNVIGLLNAVFM